MSDVNFRRDMIGNFGEISTTNFCLKHFTNQVPDGGPLSDVLESPSHESVGNGHMGDGVLVHDLCPLSLSSPLFRPLRPCLLLL